MPQEKRRNNVTRIRLEEIPKLELHLHLEGAVPLDALWNLLLKYGGNRETADRETLRRRFQYRDFKHFIETWVWKNQFIREYEDFTLIAESVARNLLKQNILYVEIFVSPPDFFRIGLKTQRIVEAVRRGFDRVPEVETQIVVDLVRDFGPEWAETTLREAAEVKDLGIPGIGIGGSEKAFPPEPFARVFETARKLGFRTSAHAGEAAGAGSIWAAIEHLKVDRIGHGTSAQDDPVLLEYLVSHRIPVEMCPISNVRTGAVLSYAQHPVRRMYEMGALISINTDDPMMFGNTLAGEYLRLMEDMGFTWEDIQALIFNAVEMSWMSNAQKEQWKSRWTHNKVMDE